MPTRPKTVLIYTMHNDWHAVLAEAALKARGHRVLRYFSSDFSERAEIEFHHGRREGDLYLHTIDGCFALSEFDVVWNRRMTQPQLPPGIDRRDQAYVAQQLRFGDASLRSLLRDAFWINPFAAARSADHKPLQLRHAQRNGLRIPETLVSNRPQAIRRFIAEHGAVIHKPLVGAAWNEEGRTLSTYTASVSDTDLPEDPMVRAAPGIFQARVPKQYEVRAQFFGASCFAIKIDGSRVDYGDMDWRLRQNGAMVDGSVVLPDAVYDACLRQLESLGLVAGAFDFIVTPDDEWVYLEVNEAGQFIFVEAWCPELPLFDALCGFIESADPRFRYRPGADRLRLDALLASVEPAAVCAADKARRDDADELPAAAAEASAAAA